MACGYRKAGMAGREAVFHLFFRKHPFDGGFTVAAGLAEAVAALPNSHRRLLNPHTHPVGLEPGLYELRQRLILQARGATA